MEWTSVKKKEKRKKLKIKKQIALSLPNTKMSWK